MISPKTAVEPRVETDARAAQKLAESPNTKIIIFGDSKIPVILGGQ